MAQEYDFEGRLGAFTLIDVIQFITWGSKTGVLALTEKNSQRFLTFEQGMITYVAAHTRMTRLGELLLKAQKLTPNALSLALNRQASDPRQPLLGQLLLEMQLVKPDDLQICIDQQLEEMLYNLFFWKNCHFGFKVNVLRKAGGREVNLDGSRVILDSIRRIDEWVKISPVVPSVQAVFQAVHPLPADILQGDAGTQREQKESADSFEDWLGLDEEENLWTIDEDDLRIYHALDGYANVVQVANACGATQLATAKSIYKLAHRDLVQAVQPHRYPKPQLVEV